MNRSRRIAKKALTAMLVPAMVMTGSLATVSAEETAASFAQQLKEAYESPAQQFKTEARWWLACASHTDETINEEIQTLHDQGFTGFELCLLDEEGVDNNIYGYGSEEWSHDVKTAITKATELGMSVGLTSGTHWHDANIPGLDPNSEAAGQEAAWTRETVAAGTTRSGELTLPGNRNAESQGYTADQVTKTLIGVYAYRIADAGEEVLNEDGTVADPSKDNPMILDQSSVIDLTEQVVDNTLEWTAPEDGDYALFGLWQQGTFQQETPAQEKTYAINYYNEAGVEALKEYLSKYIFSDEELVSAIKEGNVQFFMDSLEINNSNGTRSMYWTKDMAEEFQNRKGYDIRPYLPLFAGIGVGMNFAGIVSDNNAQPVGPYQFMDTEDQAGTTLTWQILNDFYDVQTELIQEKLITPLNNWGKENYNMAVRAQNAYGTYMEISEMTMAADYVETESLNMKDQPELYRLGSGGAHIMNKQYSSETGAAYQITYALTEEDYLYMAYNLYAGGGNRVIWHGHSSAWGPDEVTQWPGHEGMGAFISERLDSRQPNSLNYAEMNDHLGRIQELLREGTSRTDLGILHLRYGENTAYPFPRADAFQDHTGYYWTDLSLQDAGFTYDYFSPAFLNEMTYDAETGTLGENVGYQAILLNQQALPVEYAQTLLGFAKEGLKVVIVGDAGSITPFSSESSEDLAAIMDEMKALDNVVVVESEADAYAALQEMNIRPRAELNGGGSQIITAMREADGNKYLYAYNYCSDEYCGENHGLTANTEISLDGTYIPYAIDSWTGKVEKVSNYRWEDGRTILPMSLDYMNVALYAFEAADAEELHVAETDAPEVHNVEDAFVVRSTESGTFNTTLSDGSTYSTELTVPAATELTGWTLKVEDWQPGEKLTRTETRNTTVYDPETDSFNEQEVTTTEIKVDTSKEELNAELDSLTTWDNIDSIGKDVSGVGYYSTTFSWDASAAAGAYLDLGEFPETAEVYVNGEKADAVSATKSIVDISSLLKDGENTLDITVTTTLTNRLLALGMKEEAETVNFNSYSVHYYSNGLSKATLIPYAEAAL